MDSRYRFIIKYWDSKYSLYFDTEEEGWAKVEADKLDVQDVYEVPVKVEKKISIKISRPTNPEYIELDKAYSKYDIQCQYNHKAVPRSKIDRYVEECTKHGWPLPLFLRWRVEGKLPVTDEENVPLVGV